MSPFKARKISYYLCGFCIVFGVIGILSEMYMEVVAAVMIITLGIMFLLLLKYWKCPHCKNYFPLTMSLDAKYCPECGEKLQ